MRKNKRIISITAIIIFTLTMFSINVYAGSGSSKLQSTEHESKQSRSTNDVFELEGSCGENVRYLFNSETGKLTISGTGTWHKVNWLSGLGKLVKSVIIEEEVNNIPCAAFVGCINLTSVTIPNSVTQIDSCAFRGCKNLKEIVIPGSVVRIGSHAFYWCRNLDSVTYLGNIPPNSSIENTYIFGYCSFFDGKAVNVPYNYEGTTFCGCKIRKGSV